MISILSMMHILELVEDIERIDRAEKALRHRKDCFENYFDRKIKEIIREEEVENV